MCACKDSSFSRKSHIVLPGTVKKVLKSALHKVPESEGSKDEENDCDNDSEKNSHGWILDTVSGFSNAIGDFPAINGEN